MKKIVLIAMVVLMLGLAVPASAQGQEYVGDRLNLRDGNQNFPAGVPFHIVHGIGYILPGAETFGLNEVDVEIDGVPVQEDFIDRLVEHWWDGTTLWNLWVFNFPEGMTGTHIFTLHYYCTCWIYNGIENCPRSERNDLVETGTFEVKVKFVH
jgi:hypothetical protein